jgi:hypothetical protein
MPMSMIFLTPNFTSASGRSSMKPTSDAWPRVIFVAAFAIPLSFRKRFVNA